MENDTMTMTPAIQWIDAAFGMPTYGLALGCASDRSFDLAAGFAAVERIRPISGVVVKGHVGRSFDATTVPGLHAWSPPPC